VEDQITILNVLTDGSARLFVEGVLALPTAVLLEFDALAVVGLVLLGDVVTALAFGALKGDPDALVTGFGHVSLSLP
jgi:hypothetical protein